ncbi:MAG: hypothetical protein JJU41_02370 [Bacteroidetes bacterium]|nr:hypothetical protein [Bacteroidota bacterium]MCH8523255.1 hypothetical protein [Balneolales bacterium]
MDLWLTTLRAGDLFTDFAVLGCLLLVGGFLQYSVPVFKRNYIPANVIAGLVGLILATTGLTFGLISSERLGIYVYHLLALLFIALSLRENKSGTRAQSIKIGLLFISTYLIQAIVGLSVAFMLIYTVYPDLFAGIGLLMPLAFGMNPGIAFSIGQNWEYFGFEQGGTTGLAFAAIGFTAAYTIGIIMVKKGLHQKTSTHIFGDDRPEPTVSLNPETKVLHWALIGATYLITVIVLNGVEIVLKTVNMDHEITTLWSFHFIFAALTALLFRKIIDFMSLSHWIHDKELSDNGNILMDFMVVASISAITIAVIKQYWLALMVMSILVTIVTWFYLSRITRMLYKEQALERNVAIFGNMTGTMQSALVLLRIVDPEHKTSVSQELVYGSGLALLFGFPLLLIINAPVLYFENVLTGFWFSLLLIILYLAIIMLAIWRLRSR